MGNKNYKEERFDSFLNKTIILSSRYYFKKNMNIKNKENTLVDNENFANFLQGFISLDNSFMTTDKVELYIELKRALTCLSDIEQEVIFYLFEMELLQSEVADILNIYSKTVSKIKVRAIEN